VKVAGCHIGEVNDLSIRRARDWFGGVMPTLTPQRAGDRAPHPARDRGAAAVPGRCRARLPLARPRPPRRSRAARASASASPRRSARADRRALRAGRALDRPAPARQRTPARRRCGACATSATPCWSSSTTRTRSAAADHLIDIGPAAGKGGGRVIAQGTPAEVERNPASLTGQYLSGRGASRCRRRAAPSTEAHLLRVVGARGNNLKDVTAEIPLGTFTCITGVSGGGKSTLVIETLYKAASRRLMGSGEVPAPHDRASRARASRQDHRHRPVADRPHAALQPRDLHRPVRPIRDWFAELPDASRARGYKPGRFSFNVKGGRCEACQGDGVLKIEMHFLPDVYVTCDTCKGKRYNRETLEVKFRGKSIADVLDMTVDEGVEFFSAVPAIRDKLTCCATWASATSISASRRRRSRAARRSASSCRRSCRAAPPAAPSTSSTSRPPACISRTCASCSKCCTRW
jgi:excinuclease ABC subunit A